MPRTGTRGALAKIEKLSKAETLRALDKLIAKFVALGLATATVRESLKSSRPEEGAELTLAEMLAAIRQPVREAPEPETETGDEITTIDQLGAALGVTDGIEQFEQSLGLGGEVSETSWNGSSK